MSPHFERFFQLAGEGRIILQNQYGFAPHRLGVIRNLVSLQGLRDFAPPHRIIVAHSVNGRIPVSFGIQPAGGWPADEIEGAFHALNLKPVYRRFNLFL
jgi:hypothetical protein